jgi:hypothetical protein
MDPAVEIAEPIFEVDVVLLPCHAVDSRGCFVLQHEEAILKSVDCYMVQ